MSQRPEGGTTRGQMLIGKLSGKRIAMPDVNLPPMPALVEPGVILNGSKATQFELDSSRGYPDIRSFTRKFGLVIPATNTSMEHELWSMVVSNQRSGGLDGIGFHTTNVITPTPRLGTEEDILEYKRQFLGGLKAAVDTALLAQPQYLILGMSLEHILVGLENIRGAMTEIEGYSALSWATWHEAIGAALRCFGTRRIGLLTPFDKRGNESAVRMFNDLGFDVAANVGFSCAHALHIAHLPDWAKERATMELLATDDNRLDAVVQCGTNMSMIAVAEKLEPVLGIPILGVNAVLLWYALRENGFTHALHGAGRLLREF